VIGIDRGFSPSLSHGSSGQDGRLLRQKSGEVRDTLRLTTLNLETFMIRALSIATLAATALAIPAYAGEPAANDTAAVSAHASELAAAQASTQARNLLASQGYTNVSALDRDQNGRWTGTADKGGKTLFVAIDLPAPKAGAATN
jgi:putative membrane protein